ncbi:TetR/AcrR family transcriptional regulator [Phenylobacterium sp.]|uniref:TetR/AcrR family transcriptional regulator n=1 Tax=Phenylobacterium sp. TaxID=1871053 RepID=UPI0035B4C388
MGTRLAMVEAAAGLLDREGPAGVTLRAVAKAVGVSHNAPLKHFRDKEALLAAVAAAELRKLAEARLAVSPTLAPLTRVKRMLMVKMRWALLRPQRFKLTYGAWSRPDEDLSHAAHEAREIFVQAVANAQSAGELPKGDPERVASLMRAITHGAVDLALSGHLDRKGKGRADPQDLIEDLFVLLAARKG